MRFHWLFCTNINLSQVANGRASQERTNGDERVVAPAPVGAGAYERGGGVNIWEGSLDAARCTGVDATSTTSSWRTLEWYGQPQVRVQKTGKRYIHTYICLLSKL